MGAAIAAVILRKERDIVDELRYAGALSPSTAHSIQELGIDEDIGFRRLRSHEAVREATPGHYYLDEGVWAAVRRTRRRLILVILAVALIVMGGIAAGFFSFS
ncbi:MAG: hypothetical protein ACR2MQ_13110 [Gemmatimonadaceae bacterium]